MRRTKVGIIGGGAAGMIAAITAARQGAEVTILERNDRVGKKILATGNGKCNLGNEKLSMEAYYNRHAELVGAVLEQFGTAEMKEFFQGIGLWIKNKNGYLYPVSEQAASVLDVLRYEMQVLHIQVYAECKINHIAKEKNGTIIVGDGKNTYKFDTVILACGGKAAPKTGTDGSGFKLAKQLGHRVIPTVPALVQLRCSEDYLKAVSGVRTEAEISVLQNGQCVAKERGELQLTEYGISGIPVFQLSRIVNYILRDNKETEACINLFPEYDDKMFEQMILRRKALQKNRTVEEFFTGMLNKKLMLNFIRMAGLKGNCPMEQVDAKAVREVYRLCRGWKLHVTGSNSYENAQVCAGGVDMSEITSHMESKKTPGVFFAGEILDVDGKCGGYNLQWAWASGYVAGLAAAK